MLNVIHSDIEYIYKGFTPQEVPLIKRHDILFNLSQLRGLDEEEEKELSMIVEELGL